MAKSKIEIKVESPTPEQVKAARLEAGLSQTAAANLIHCHWQAWVKWEHYDKTDKAQSRRMHPGLWELFQIKAAKLKGKKRKPKAETAGPAD